jgi:Protein of unknown function (DUF4031)
MTSLHNRLFLAGPVLDIFRRGFRPLHHARVEAVLINAIARETPPMVYVDDAIWNWQGLKWCHLLADDIDELHGFAARLGISRASYQGPPKTTAPHYDLTGFERVRALALGAKPCSRQEIVAVFRVLRVAGGKRTRK